MTTNYLCSVWLYDVSFFISLNMIFQNHMVSKLDPKKSDTRKQNHSPCASRLALDLERILSSCSFDPKEISTDIADAEYF